MKYLITILGSLTIITPVQGAVLSDFLPPPQHQVPLIENKYSAPNIPTLFQKIYNYRNFQSSAKNPAYQIRTYQDGSMLYLESSPVNSLNQAQVISNNAIRVGVDTRLGGAITEVSLNSVNFVNSYDAGREIQLSFYDGAQRYEQFSGSSGVFGWNPVQGGDKYNHGSSVITSSLNQNIIYTKSQPLEWNPDDKGGNARVAAVASDIIVEQWVQFLPNNPTVVKVTWRTTHLGANHHYYYRDQEMPSVYLNGDFNRFVYYDGLNPWSGGATKKIIMRGISDALTYLYTPEYWGSFVDGNDNGLTVFAPGQQPYIIGFSLGGAGGSSTNPTNFFRFITPLTVAGSKVINADFYLIPGNVQQARQKVYQIKNSNVPTITNAEPIIALDTPRPNQQISGTMSISGWVLDETPVRRVNAFIDDVLMGRTRVNLERGDVAQVFPYAPSTLGFNLLVNTTQLTNGPHTLRVEVRAGDRKKSLLPPLTIRVAN